MAHGAGDEEQQVEMVGHDHPGKDPYLGVVGGSGCYFREDDFPDGGRLYVGFGRGGSPQVAEGGGAAGCLLTVTIYIQRLL